jgi:CRP/FNR family transcriptional regulator/CRP/FNR family cyclic AMP-dependent transcriptional regulator
MAAMVPGSPQGPLVREALVACRLFAGLEASKMDLVIGAMRARRFRRGEVIFHGGDPGDSLFIVASGSVKIMVDPEDGSEPAILTTVGAGGFFGELALLDGRARSATAVAVDRVETLVLRRDAFDKLIAEEPAISRALLVALAGEIRRLTDQLEDLHFLDLPGRLARHLLRQIVPDGQPVPAGEVRQPWPYTQGELAGMIGGSRQSVNRLLADFVAKGLLRFEGDFLVIPDSRRLAEAVNG